MNTTMLQIEPFLIPERHRMSPYRRTASPTTFRTQALLEQFKGKFREFLSGHRKNTWIELHLDDEKVFEIYVRKDSYRSIAKEQPVTSCDIANINAHPTGTGLGSAIINYVHTNNPYDITYVESINNERLYGHLIRTYWLPHFREPICVYRLTKYGTSKFPNIGLIKP